VQRFADVTVFHHQRRRAPVRDNAMINILSEGTRRNGRAGALKPKPKEK
jgi:hypothetical protein